MPFLLNQAHPVQAQASTFGYFHVPADRCDMPFADQARPVRAQASIFGYFSQVLEAQIRVAKSRGEYDDGIVRLKAESVERQGPPEFIHEEAGSGDFP